MQNNVNFHEVIDPTELIVPLQFVPLETRNN